MINSYKNHIKNAKTNKVERQNIFYGYNSMVRKEIVERGRRMLKIFTSIYSILASILLILWVTLSFTALRNEPIGNLVVSIVIFALIMLIAMQIMNIGKWLKAEDYEIQFAFPRTFILNIENKYKKSGKNEEREIENKMMAWWFDNSSIDKNTFKRTLELYKDPKESIGSYILMGNIVENLANYLIANDEVKTKDFLNTYELFIKEFSKYYSNKDLKDLTICELFENFSLRENKRLNNCIPNGKLKTWSSEYIETVKEQAIKIVKVYCEYGCDPVWCYDNEGIVTKKWYPPIKDDKNVYELCSKISNIYDSCFETNSHEQAFWYNEEKHSQNKYVLLDLIEQLVDRLNQINDGSYEVHDLETKALNKLKDYNK